MTKRDKMKILKDSIIDYVWDRDKFEDVNYYFENFLNVKLTNRGRSFLGEFSRNVNNLWYEKNNYWYAEYVARKKLNKLIKFILTYNNK